MTLAEHLAEVRHRFLVSAITVSVFGVVAFIFYNQILHFLQEPYCAARNAAHKGCTFLVTAPLDGLTLRIKIAFFGGILAASPVLFWQLWRFITPGLKARERKYIIPFVSASLVLDVYKRQTRDPVAHAEERGGGPRRTGPDNRSRRLRGRDPRRPRKPAHVHSSQRRPSQRTPSLRNR